MKKVMLGMAIMGLCSFGAYTATAQAQTASQTQEAIVIPDPPKFASENVNKGVGELVSLIKTYAPAIKANDTAKLMEFGAKMQTWQQGAASWGTELTPDEQTKFQEYMQQVGNALQPASGPAEAAPATDTPAK